MARKANLLLSLLLAWLVALALPVDAQQGTGQSQYGPGGASYGGPPPPQGFGDSRVTGGGSGNATALQGNPVSATSPSTGQTLQWNGSTWIPLATNAAQLQGNGVSNSAPATNNCLTWNGSQWAPTGCSATSLQGNAVSNTAPTTGFCLVWSGTQWAPAACNSNTNATQLQGNAISSASPTTGQVLEWNGTNWIPTTLYTGLNTVTGRFAETPCSPVATSGTINLDLSTCSGPSSTDVFHIGPLTGSTTITFTNPVVGQTFRLEINANGQSVTLPACVGPAVVSPAGNSFIVYDVFDLAPTYWCPAGVQANLTGVGVTHVQSISVATSTGTGNQTTGSFTAAAAGQSILCTLSIDAGNFINTMVDSASNSYTLGTNLSSTAGATNMRYAYALNITGAPTTFTFNLSASGQVRSQCDTFAGATAIRTAVNAANIAASTTPSLNITGISVNDMIWSGFLNGAAATASAGSGYTLGNANLTGAGVSTEWGLATGSGTIAMTWNQTASTNSSIDGLAIH